jgi:putative membrane protein
MTSSLTMVVAGAMSVAAALLGYVFVRESLLFDQPSTRRMFEVAPEQAGAIRLRAFHQGVYNLLVGTTALVGAIALLDGATTVGITLIVAAGSFMVIAAIALVVADPRRGRIPGLFAQALPPAVALFALALA